MTKRARPAAHWSGMPKGFWSYEAPDPGAPPPGWTEKDWHSLSPGMRREIKRPAKEETRYGN